MVFLCLRAAAQDGPAAFQVDSLGTFRAPAVEVMLFDDFYPEGHQGGLTIVQSGVRIAANGDLRLEPTPGQWSPVPKMGERSIDRARGAVSTTLWYPDSSRNGKGFNPIPYPDLHLRYTVSAQAEGASLRLRVDLEKPLPPSWGGIVGFNLELFPGSFFGEHYLMDEVPGAFPRHADLPVLRDASGMPHPTSLAHGHTLVLAPGNPGKQLRVTAVTGDLELFDGRALANNGWFVLRSTIPAGRTIGAVEWVITPSLRPGWLAPPVIQVSQVGYHPNQQKFAVVELDRATPSQEPLRLVRITGEGRIVVKTDAAPVVWGTFLRSRELRFDFSDVREEGLYAVQYGAHESHAFEIRRDIFAQHVWQPTMEYFLPVQMCHMLIRDRYKVWHGLCHMDDAMMAPTRYNHFDGYLQGDSTLTSFSPGDHVPGLNVGGWHDAGDYDLRLESQTETIYKLALAVELFHPALDQTTVDQAARTVEIHRPDGVPDFLQQIEHGVLSVLGGYRSLGRVYRGIIEPTIPQYVHLGDAALVTDNLVFDSTARDPLLHHPLPRDDRYVFTEANPWKELAASQALAAASRVLATWRPALAAECLAVSRALYHANAAAPAPMRIAPAAELYLTTNDTAYARLVLENIPVVRKGVERLATVIGRFAARLHDPAFTRAVEEAVRDVATRAEAAELQNPYSVPYSPYIWGAGWGIQGAGVQNLFLHLAFPDLIPARHAWNALEFVLGVHPGENTSSFVSGVGVRSLTVAYGVNRDEWSHIPGGVASGTALIRPDLPELKEWPYLWQQTEYVLGGGTTDYLLLSLAADALLNK